MFSLKLTVNLVSVFTLRCRRWQAFLARRLELLRLSGCKNLFGKLFDNIWSNRVLQGSHLINPNVHFVSIDYSFDVKLWKFYFSFN